MQNEAPKDSGIALAWATCSRRKWLAILVFAGAFSPLVSFVTFQPDIYESSATLLVERQQVPEAFVRNTITSPLETRLQVITEEILSRSRLEDLITRFGLYTGFRKWVSPEAAIGRVRRNVQLGGVKGRAGTVTFSISYRGSDPQVVALVTNTLASFYIEENLKVRERQAAGTAAFLRAQLEEVKQRLEQQEQRVSQFKRRFIGELPQQMQANLATLEGLNVQLRLNSDNQTRALERRETLAKELAGAESLGPAGAPEATAARIARLKKELMDLSMRFSEKYPDVILVKLEIAALERQLAEAKRDREEERNEQAPPDAPRVLQLKQVLIQVDEGIKELKREEKRLRDAIATYQRRVEGTPQREQEFQEVSRDDDTTKQLYRTLSTRYEEAQLAESLEQRQKGEQFRILDPAIPSNKPAAPDRFRLILMGLFLSIGLAAGAVVVAERLDTSFHTADDLRAFAKVPVLASIPRIVTEADASQRRWRFRLVAVAVMLGLGLVVASSYLIARGEVPLVGDFAESWLLRS